MRQADFSNIQHIIWDWNGTLLDDLQVCVEIINSLLAERGLERVSTAEYREVFGFPVIDYYRRLGFDFDLEPFETISTLFITSYEKHRKSCQLMPGSASVLEKASLSGITQSILSASKRAYLDQAVKEYQIDQYFILIDGLDDHHAAGKKTLAKQHILSLPYPADRILMVGDTTHDAEIAQELQISCCLIPKGHHSQNKLKMTGCHLEESLEVLSAILTPK